MLQRDAFLVNGQNLLDRSTYTGMVFRATGGIYPPNPTYFHGRYSNGRVWIEYLSERLHLSTKQINNFAYGGATTGSTSNSYVPSLLQQVQSFTQRHQKTNSDALYVFWAGANDYLQGVSSATVPVKNIMSAINLLTDIGSQKFLVANLPDLGQFSFSMSIGKKTVRFDAIAPEFLAAKDTNQVHTLGRSQTWLFDGVLAR
ncbi:SGNH/GDSL hydrolase family protein [Nostoc sp.]|uniref:SGNH/GDSL hydrolase family protein n=1 Tax=Nostoc sp. TaxID=1180 RepID=UPI002FF548AA